MTNDGPSMNTIVYDAENHAVSSTNGSSSGTYTYDGNGLRVKKVSGSTTTVTIFSGGKDIAEYQNGAAPSSPTNEYIYSGGQVVASIQSGATYYFHQDHLSLRVRTNSTGAVTDQRGTFPFGEQWYSTVGGAVWLFTSYYRDTESGNDYAMARTYINRLARFSSLDLLSGDISNPQSLDLYDYVSNDATDFADPTGQFPRYGPLVTVGGKWYGSSAGNSLEGGEISGVEWIDSTLAGIDVEGPWYDFVPQAFFPLYLPGDRSVPNGGGGPQKPQAQTSTCTSIPGSRSWPIRSSSSASWRT